MRRREFLQRATAVTSACLSRQVTTAARGEEAGWNSGSVRHLLPTVNDRRMLLKASFQTALLKPPRLVVGKRVFTGRMTDTRGLFWAFDATGLEPARPYRLTLLEAAGKPLCDSWPLTTFPAPSERPSKLRLLIYTCAGGHEALRDDKGRPAFLPLATRRRLLKRALSFNPDALVANGDHVYWDQRAGRSAALLRRTGLDEKLAGRFNRTLPVFGTANEIVLERAAGPQIADLYGTLCRSVPVFFIQDDHDYFDNDQANDQLITFPPDHFMLRLGRASQRLYYPEFLPDETRPAGLPGASEPDQTTGVSECFGALRYGRLAELLMYDCRRFQTLHGPGAVYVPREAEQWLTSRMASSDAAHVVNAPSLPVGWSAGKWGDWYPDVLDDRGKLTTGRPKPYWQAGWRAQHDRLLAAASAMKNRIPLFINGDLHSIAAERIFRSGQVDLRANPVVSLLTGPLGTAVSGWPSAVRGVRAQPPSDLEVEENLPVIEEEGFVLADFTPDRIVIRFFRWRADQPEEAPEKTIDSLQPFRVLELERPG